MSDPVLEIESSSQDSEPRELFDIAHGTTTYRLTSATRDLAFGGSVYTATANARGEIGRSASGDVKEMSLFLPINHAFVRRYLQHGVPPMSPTCRLRRLYVPDNEIEQIWFGPIVSMSVDDMNATAEFRVASQVGRATRRILPTLTLSRSCSHTLYDATCGISRAATGPDGFPYKHTTTVNSVNGRDVRIDLTTVTPSHARRATWLVNGELVHVASGERRTIAAQADLAPGSSTLADVTLNLLIPGMKIGDAIEVYAGCAWDVATCDLKFGNIGKFSGCPYMPTSNPYVPGTKVKA